MTQIANIPARCVFTAFITSAMVACGGGGGGGGTTTPPPVTTPPPPTDPFGAIGTLEEEQDRLFESIGVGIIAPAYETMATESQTLKTAIDDYCDDTVNGDLAATQEIWRDAMIAWQNASIVRFGPVEENNRRLRIQFFPDSNNAVVNNVTSVLNGGSPITEPLVASSPVGAQGLPALEYLLFDLGGLDDATNGPRRCELATAIAANFQTIAEELAAAWDPAGQLLADFTSASGTYMDRNEVLTDILESLAQDTEFVADEKVTRPQQTGANTTESFRSEQSLANLIANTAAIRAFLDRGNADTDYGFRDYLTRAHDSGAIADQLDQQLAAAESGLAVLSASLEDILLGAETGDIDVVRTSLQDLADSFVDSAIAADVNLGFNNQDGD
ncbi:MAG: imelysin family protein [Pseudomonadota bacterium]